MTDISHSICKGGTDNTMICFDISQIPKRSRLFFAVLLFVTGVFLIIAAQFPSITMKFVTTNIRYHSPRYFITFHNSTKSTKNTGSEFFRVPNSTTVTGFEFSRVPNTSTSVHFSTEFRTSTSGILRDRFRLIPGCSKRNTGVEDILCMEKPDFLPQYRNPCWIQDGRLRCLPYFHIIGVCKSGTSDLFKRISRHPHILQNKGILDKELWYWTWKRYGDVGFHRRTVPKMTLDNFIDSFNAEGIRRIRVNHSEHGNGSFYPAVTGHGDPMDFWDQGSWQMIPQNDPELLIPEFTAPDLIKHVNPDVKLILMLRDPIERLFSHYLHGQFGKSAAQFHNDVTSAVEDIQSCNRTMSIRACLYSKDNIRSLKAPIYASFYSVHLAEWLRVFPRKQILILRTEDFSKDPASNLIKIFRFLKLDPLPTKDLFRTASMPHFYFTRAKKFAGSILPETEKLLQTVFEPYNRELANMLNDTRYLWNT